jgi:hypothetical protein
MKVNKGGKIVTHEASPESHLNGDDFEDYWSDILPEYVPPPEPPSLPSKDFQQRAIEAFFGAYVAPQGTWVGLMGLDGEVSGDGYVRVPFNPPPAENGSIAANVSFPEARGDWSTVTGYAIFDAPTGGNLLFRSRRLPNSLRVFGGMTLNVDITINI